MIKTLIAEDMHMVRGALVVLLKLEPDIEVVAEVADGNEILPAVQKTQPNIAVIDIDLPGKDGLTAAMEIHKQVPRCRTLMLTSLNKPGLMRRALDARVEGFILKDAPADRLANAIRAVHAGRRVMDPELAVAAWDGTSCPLTSRECEVLRLAAAGCGPREIAARLYISTGTVRNYLTSIVTKLQARNRVDAIRIAQESDWL
ncbi:MAG TPA: response regulator transcription factor [Actinophytocola sp.]|uniref:response regulator transcription factor n=1 Tax=Actinophytocola sp. TaxID=1872138 RepID=UPI002DDD6990|nr:response regulator transcription factor [Actinophytocola sp.]HEV2781372.1 response regulator transcription factor [Actinophytocola sp.]